MRGEWDRKTRGIYAQEGEHTATAVMNTIVYWESSRTPTLAWHLW